MAASVEDQIASTTTTHVEVEDHHMVDAPVEDHMVDAPVEDQPADPPVEDHLAAPAEDNNTVVLDPAESHSVVVPDPTGDGDHHMVAAAHVEEKQDHLVTVEDHVVVADQMEAIHIVGVDQMEPVHAETQMVATGDELAIMSHNQHDEQQHQQMSAFNEEKMLITPYEDKILTPYEAKTPGSYENNNNNNNNEAANPETQPSKRRKKKSIVWEHFTIETVSAGCRRACCKQCKQTFAYSTGSKVAGTSHLKRHIAKGTCQDKGLTPYTPASRGGCGGRNNSAGTDQPRRRYRTSAAAPQVLFDADRCRHEIARMIIMHDYPLHLVEHPGFLTFVRNLQPQFQMVSFNAVQGDCVATYLMEKQHLIKFIEGIPGRVCLTLDMWTSSQSVGYVFVTGHFIDGDWKLQKRLLNVVMEPHPDSDAAFSHAVAVCLHDWNLKNKLFSITLNQPLREAAIENLRPLLTVKNPLVLEGQLILQSCLARTFSGIAVAVLDEGREVVEKVRESVKHVKTSDSLEEKQQLQVPSEKTLSVDDQTQWNTTYQMLAAASELKKVFTCLDTSDLDYKGAPTGKDWKQVETLCSYLKLLFDSIGILAAATTMNPTPITFFHEVWTIQSELSRAVASEDPFTSSITRTMQDGINRYWKECSLALAAAVVMDPRFKMKLVEFSFNKIYGDEAPARIKAVDEGIHELFDEYVALPLPLTPTYAEDGSHAGGTHIKSEEHQGGGPGLLSDNGLMDFDVYIMETTSQQMKSELDQYLDESLLPRVHEFDVLGWWKLNKIKYPTLSKMARDILSVPVSVAPPDSIFGTAVKKMDGYRSLLRPETVEALICAKDWMLHGASEASNALVRMEY